MPLTDPTIDWTLNAVSRENPSPAVAVMLTLLADTFAARR